MDNYEVVRTIGNGNYGTCFLVRNKSDGGQYALKRIPIGKREESEAALQEAQVLKKLKHPNIISFKESFLHEGALCIVTSFCEEGDLFTRIRDNAKKQRFFPQEQIVEWFCQIALGLQYMHQHKILHRDLKTQNIFIARGGMIKLGDFGIAKVLEGTDDFATTVTGTPYYMAPEVCTNQPYTLKSDVWSLGCVLYEMCTLKHAFAADSLLGLVYQIVQGNCPPIPAERYDNQLSNLVAQMLARDSTKRPSTAQMLQEPWVKMSMEQMRTRGLRTLKAKPRASMNKSSVRGSALNTMSGTSAAFDDTSGKSMNPREQLAARKRAEADRRAAELKNATVHQVQALGKAKDRKFKEFHCSKFGAPDPSEWQPGDTDASVHGEQLEEPLDNASMAEHLASLVNLGGTVGEPSESQWLVSERASGEGRLPGDGHRPTVTNEELPRPQFKPELGPSHQDALGYGEGTTGFYTAGDTVMFGTANPTPPHGAALGTNPFPVQDAYVASPPPAVAGMIPHDEKPVGTPSGFNDTGCSVLLGTAEGTMPAADQMHMLAGTGGTVMLGATQDSVLAGTVQQQRPPALAPDMTIGKAGSTALAPGSPSLLATARSQALALESSDDDDVMLGTMGTLQTLGNVGQALGMERRGETVREEEEEEESYENDFEDYESDFEEDTPEDDPGPNTASGAADGRVGGEEQSEGVSTSRAVRREDMMSLRFCIESQLDGEPEDEVADEVVEDCVPMSFRERQLEAHREKCRAALGPFYDEVLTHLRRVRRSGNTVDEQQLKHDLLDLVNGDKQKMLGCFEVDMLVYKEVML
ncbi:hypothetical protein CYMTET_22428 [Cymbomonas tetramitiformis]|uniref:non-specific serine/threonine protein kinase n=1 Tax=Cymbomonas tetramitiformis TaxID=36881 RepID=A0AAE0L2A4_9CHLO|nr:hypothetical protein CYMTET_22428 [Cymbomonas tetramitiformis]